ncbi:MAG: response regulator transcription factor [Bacteroidetes bacterium]|nr:response regulator transcription factor [Bacteroidota bacterium]MBU1720276.1 response regulator transcription factor [Bacteroidota bacterium]
MKNTKGNILLAEDDPNLGMVIQDYLQVVGFEVKLVDNGRKALEAFRKDKPDICVLDVMMPEIDGFTVAIEIRKTDADTPIIFLTARAMKDDRIRGFKAGGDDYITKPFSTEELSLRIEAILKRYRKQSSKIVTESGTTCLGLLTFDYENLTLHTPVSKITLTRKEADLLNFFCQNIGKVVTREEALKAVWGDDDYFMGRSMDVFISRLRKYLREDPDINIRNIHGTGFRLTVQNE